MALILVLEKEENTRTVLYMERSRSYKSVFDDYLKYKQIDVRESLDFQNIEAIKQCVKSGSGISLVHYFSVKEELESNKLSVEEIAPEHSAISTFLTYHKDKWLSPSMKSMISLIRNHVEN